MRDIIKLLHGKSESEKKKIIDSFTDEEAAEFLEYVETHKDEMGKEADRFTFKRILSVLSTLLTSNQSVIAGIEQLKDNGNITVENEVKLAEPAWYGKGLKNLTTGLVEAIKGTPVNVANEEPLTVKLVDKDGKPADFKPVVNFSGNSGSLLVVEKLNEVKSAIENIEVPAPPAPEGGATEAKQDDTISAIGTASSDIVSAIEGITIPAPTGGATEAKQDTLITHVDGVETLLGEIKTELEAKTEPANGQVVTGGVGQTADVKVTLDSESVAVTGTFWQTTQPVSATDLDVRDLTASDVVTVTGGAGQTGDVKVTLDSEAVAISGSVAVTGPLTDTQLRATPVPVSGSFSAAAGILKKTVALTGSGTVHTTTAGKVLRVFSVKFSVSADMTDVAFKFASGSAFEKYLAPKAGGLYGANNHPDYIAGGTAEALNCDITGTGTVQINLDYIEV